MLCLRDILELLKDKNPGKILDIKLVQKVRWAITTALFFL